MRVRPPGYTPAELDRLVFGMFIEMPGEAFIARQLGISARDVEHALERFVSRVAELADEHWRARIARQLDELARIVEHLSETDPPLAESISARVRAAALRASFTAISEAPDAEIPTPPARTAPPLQASL